jgi:hypothetical protein
MCSLKAIILATAILLVFGCNARKDQADAQKAAERVHILMKGRDFQTIYRESAETFKAEGDESKFVNGMKSIHDVAGDLKSATPLVYQSSFDSSVGVKHILTFRLEFDRGPGEERLVFTRSKNGEMQLWDLVMNPIE